MRVDDGRGAPFGRLWRWALGSPVMELSQCSVAPTLDQIALYCEARPEANLVDALEAFIAGAVTPDHYRMQEMTDMLNLAKLVAHLPLGLEDHWMFAVAPCNAGACTRFPFQLNKRREGRSRVYKEAPGFRPGHRSSTRGTPSLP